MPLRFYKRVSILPGLRVNVSRSGASVSVGHRGAWVTMGSKGTRATVGLPGSGLFWTEHYPHAPPVQAVHSFSLLAWIALIVVVFIAFLLAFT
jgi:hypothetical protein